MIHNTIKAYIEKGERCWVAQCIEIDVVTQGETVEEAIKNLREAVSLHLEGEDLSEYNLSPNPSLLREPNLWVQVIGPDQIRVGRPATYMVKFGNIGNALALDCYIIIKFSSGCYFKVNLPSFEQFSQDYLSSDEYSLVVPVPVMPMESSKEFTFYLKTYQLGKVKM
ncbi:MAG: type II toxin-antitoxin system HicB family antitoxin [bacterium]